MRHLPPRRRLARALRTTPLLLASVLLAACPDDPAAPPAAQRVATKVDLRTLVVESTRVARETAFDGAVEAVNRASVAAQTSGRVLELPYDVGDYVESGAVIARLTGIEQRARTESAEAALAETSARLSESRLAHERTKDLYDRKLIAKAQFDASAADLASARARAEAAQASLAEARQGLDYTVVRAPYPGIVVAREVQVGETVVPGQLLMTGVSLQALRVVVEIPQRRIGPLREHRKARVILPSGASVDATALRIPPNADPDTQTFRVLVTLPPGDHGVFPGTLVKVAFISGEAERLLLPASAVVRRGEVTGVYVVSDNAIEFRYLRTGTPSADGSVPVLAGLSAGERIAADPIAAAIAYKARPAARAGGGA